MLPKKAKREEVLEQLEKEGGLTPESVEKVHRKTGVPEADIYGVATFYSLLEQPDAGVRICQGLSCKLADCERLKSDFEKQGKNTTYASCLGRCDMAPAFWDPDGDPATL